MIHFPLKNILQNFKSSTLPLNVDSKLSMESFLNRFPSNLIQMVLIMEFLARHTFVSYTTKGIFKHHKLFTISYALRNY